MLAKHILLGTNPHFCTKLCVHLVSLMPPIPANGGIQHMSICSRKKSLDPTARGKQGLYLAILAIIRNFICDYFITNRNQNSGKMQHTSEARIHLPPTQSQ